MKNKQIQYFLVLTNKRALIGYVFITLRIHSVYVHYSYYKSNMQTSLFISSNHQLMFI